jgi:hypothetical protein
VKKLILIVAALVMVASGVAAVSAYEAHMVNVKAHVELALNVTPGEKIIGGVAVFPEEWVEETIQINLSDSFKGTVNHPQTRVDTVKYIICAEPKPDPWPANHWLGGALFYRVNPDDNPSASWDWLGPAVDSIADPSGPFCPVGATGNLSKPGDLSDSIVLGLDVPVFWDYYNEDTDVENKPRPDDAVCGSKGVGEPCVIIMPNPQCLPQGCDLGVELKVQVVDILPHAP